MNEAKKNFYPMNELRQTFDRVRQAGRVVLGIGVFDGVHLGHAKLLSELTTLGDSCAARKVAVTFSPHPKMQLAPESAPKLLIGLDERIRLLCEKGADEVAVIPFTAEFASLPAEDFLEKLLEALDGQVAGICVGANWRFGQGGLGNAPLLCQFCTRHDIRFQAVEELKINGEVVSSSNIRRAVAAGLLDKAAMMLGRPYRLTGVVEKGFHYATPSLGFPTANLRLADGILMPDGVYGARALLHGKAYRAAVNIGISPSFAWNSARRRIEVHLLDFSGNIYGEVLGVEPLLYLRSERAFASGDQLKQQIEKDIKRIGELSV